MLLTILYFVLGIICCALSSGMDALPDAPKYVFTVPLSRLCAKQRPNYYIDWKSPLTYLLTAVKVVFWIGAIAWFAFAVYSVLPH